MPISDSIQAEMQKVNALFGETVVKGAISLRLIRSIRSMRAYCRRAPTLSKVGRRSRISGRGLLRA